MDTAKDARVLVLEDAIRRLNEIVSNRKLRLHIEYSKLGDSLKTAGALFYEVKYAYTEPRALSELEATKNLISAISDFEEFFRTAVDTQGYTPTSSGESVIAAEVDYALRIARGFQQRLVEYGDDPAYAVDLLAVEISQTNTVEGSKNLTRCRCTDGSRIWNVVTNLSGVRPGVILPIAILPPVNMMGLVSEAMFLAEDPLPESTELGRLKDVPASALNQARAQVLQIMKRMT
ncbi:MAG: hypothetical protein ACFFD9_11130 [Candidatus Thorarchaeota archaeon]